MLEEKKQAREEGEGRRFACNTLILHPNTRQGTTNAATASAAYLCNLSLFHGGGRGVDVEVVRLVLTGNAVAEGVTQGLVCGQDVR